MPNAEFWMWVFGTGGVLSMLVSVVREVAGWAGKRHPKQMTEARSALGALQEVGRWQDAFYAGRRWCWDKHGYNEEYPKPPCEEEVTPND